MSRLDETSALRESSFETLTHSCSHRSAPFAKAIPLSNSPRVKTPRPGHKLFLRNVSVA